MKTTIDLTWFKQKKQLVVIISAIVLLAGFVVVRYLPLHKKGKELEKSH